MDAKKPSTSAMKISDAYLRHQFKIRYRILKLIGTEQGASFANRDYVNQHMGQGISKWLHSRKHGV